MYSVLGNHKTMIHQYTVIVVIHVYNRIIVFTQQNDCLQARASVSRKGAKSAETDVT